MSDKNIIRVGSRLITKDPFAGSGTTGRACKDMGRYCVLIEREERYCEIIARRMGQECLPLDGHNAEVSHDQNGES